MLSKVNIKYTILLVITCIIIPNLVPIAIYILGYTAPDRAVYILPYTICVFYLIRSNKWYSALLCQVIYLAILLVDYIVIASKSFYILASDMIFLWINIFYLDFKHASFYVYLICIISASVILNFFIIYKYKNKLQQGNKIITFLIAVTLTLSFFFFVSYNTLDETAETNFFMGYKKARTNPPEALESAIINSNLIDYNDNKKNYIVILVEALGLPKDKTLYNTIFEPLYTEKLSEHYNVTEGSVIFHGNTTWGTIREFCGVFLNFSDILAGTKVDCVPQKMNEIGYETVAYHAFKPEFFQIEEWYPLIGFQKMVFGPALMEQPDMKICGAFFTGPCDVSVLYEIKNRMKQATKPTFAYWLTLTSHQPVPPKSVVPPRFDCLSPSQNPVQNVEACRTMEIWRELFEELAKVALDLENTEILLVGDHAPPFLSQRSREFFSTKKVPWIRLSPKKGN